jgi:hypothetical protein
MKEVMNVDASKLNLWWKLLIQDQQPDKGER